MYLGKVLFPKWANKPPLLEESLSKLIEKILGKTRWNIKAIFVYGSAATGEYTSIPHDIDILVVSHFYDPLLPQRIKSVIQNAPVEIEVDQIPLADFNRLKTMQLADVRNSGVLIYGDKNLQETSRTQEIYGYEGIKVLFNFGVMKLLDVMPKSILESSEPSPEQGRAILYSCVKAYEGVCSCLLILKNKYRVGFRARADYFSEVYEKEYPSLCEEIPHLSQKIKFAFRLRKDNLRYNGSLVDLWFDTRKDIESVIPFAMAGFFGVTQTSLPRSILMLNAFPHDVLSSLIYAFRLFSTEKKIPPISIFCLDPASKLCISSAFLLFSFDPRLNFNESFLNNAEQNLISFNPIHLKEKRPIDRWEKMRKVSVALPCIVSQWHMRDWYVPNKK